MTAFSDGVTTITPLMITGWETTRDGGNVFHNIISRADDEVTFRPAAWRTGTLVALFNTLEEALQLEAMAAKPQKLTLTDPDHPLINMTFAVTPGGINVQLDEDTRQQATCSVDFQQVAP